MKKNQQTEDQEDEIKSQGGLRTRNKKELKKIHHYLFSGPISVEHWFMGLIPIADELRQDQ